MDFEKDAHGDIHTIAGVVKLFLQELEDPLLTAELYPTWIAAVGMEN